MVNLLIDNNPTLTSDDIIVLMIEDNHEDALRIRQQLMRACQQHCRVHLVVSLAAAQALTSGRNAIQPTVVLLDLHLPDATGIDAVERCLEMFWSVPVVVIDNDHNQQMIARAIECGVEDYLQKDADGTALLRAIHHAVLRHQRAAEARLAASVFRHAQEGILISKPNGTIIDVNRAFTLITGYSRAEAIGATPRLLRSGHHPASFYSELWQHLRSHGQWSGEIWNRRKDGELYVSLSTITSVRDGRGHLHHYVALFTDISLQKAQQRQLEFRAYYDPLTELPNRALFADRLQQAMARCLRRQESIALIFLDLDGFKQVNDTYGHAVGDELLRQIADRLRHKLRDSDTLARLGGDEFVIIASELRDTSRVERLLDRLLIAAQTPVEVIPTDDEQQTDTAQRYQVQVSASIGLAFYPQRVPISAEELLHQADQVMYQAKRLGKNRYRIHYEPH